MTIKGIKKLKSILDVCIAMGYGVNQDYRKLLIGEVKHADVVIAFGKNSGLVMVREVVGKHGEDELVSIYGCG